MLTVGSLFAGIGGIDLGLERTGRFRTLWFCERDGYCQRVLAKHWPHVPILNDVADVDESAPRVDVLAGGFPCQPVSHAGRRKAQDDERWLWPHVKRCIRVLRPRGVLLENVPGLLTAGFDDVIGGLAACGYDAEWDCIPAAALGAPHLRDRVFIIAAPAMADAAQLQRDGGDDNASKRSQPGALSESGNGGWPSPMAHADEFRCHGGAGRESWRREQSENRSAPMANPVSVGQPRQGEPVHTGDPAQGEKGETAQPLDGGIKGIWPAEPNVGRVANGVPNRVDRLRALGNAVVPQVAEYVGWQFLNMMGETDE